MSAIYEPVGAYVRLGFAWVRYIGRTAPRAVFRPATLGFAYIAIALGTFGHVAAANYRAEDREYQECRRARAHTSDYDTLCWKPDGMKDGAAGVAAGMLWPLYLSWELQQ